MTMYRYKLLLNHDNGKLKLTVNATDDVMAFAMVQAIEKCPDRAIKILKREKI